MAIEKVRKTKLEISPAAAVQLGISAVLVILSLIIGYLAFVRWRFKENLVSGYGSHDSNETESARKELEAALSWKPDHAGARECLARLQCDVNDLAGAEANYNRLLEKGHAVPQVHVGLGTVCLKKADKADAKEVAALLGRARDSFEKAGGVPEGAIGLGHCDLLQAERLGAPADPRRFDAALARFRKIRSEMDSRQDYRQQITRWGLVDYYSGLGKALAVSTVPEEQKAASAAFRAWYQLARRTPVPMCNLLAMETRRYDERTYTLQEMTALKPEAVALRRETEIWKTQKDAFGKLRDPWLAYSLALAKAFLEAGSETEYDNLVRELSSSAGFENRLDVFFFDAAWRTRRAVADNPGPNPDQPVIKASAAWRALLTQTALKDEAYRRERAIAHNNFGWAESWLGSYSGNDAKLMEARNQLLDAVKLFPDDYLFNRNLCVLMKRLKRPEKEYQPYLEKAKAAPKGDLADDAARFEQYMGGQ